MKSPTLARIGGSVMALALLAACGDDDAGTGTGGGGAAGGGGGGGTSAGGGSAIVEPQRYWLRIDDGPTPAIVLDMNKQKALQVFGEAAAKEIKLLDVDTTAMLVNVLTAIQNACGTAWQNDSMSPMHDCALTALGQTFGPNWQTSDEFAMVRLLSMTPANADVTGTSLEDFASLLDENQSLFSVSFGDVLAESLGISKTAPFIPIDQLVVALQQHLLGTHPEIANPQGLMPVTMYDALLDMSPLAQKLGPIGAPPWDGPGEHPGVLVPDDGLFTTRSDALLPSFRMRVVAESNLRWVSGVDLSSGGGDMFLNEGDAALALDFMDPQKLDIVGVTANPTVDMRFSVHEVPTEVPSCTDPPNPACKMNYPPPMGTPVGTDTVWAVAPFLLEPIVARAGILTYGTRTFGKCYLVFNNECQTSVEIGQNGNPTGWSVFFNNLSFGGEPIETPPPQFLWELLSGVSQIALHDPNGDGTADIDEGDARPLFALHGVPIGLTGPELVAEMRPTLQSQAKEIADVILGRYWVNNDALDFFYRRADPGGDPILFFAADTDLRPDPQSPASPKSYTYEKPGFFSSADLRDESKVSSKTLDGVADTAHEKLRLAAGETTLYMQDDEGGVYEVRFFVPGDGALEIVADVNKL